MIKMSIIHDVNVARERKRNSAGIHSICKRSEQPRIGIEQQWIKQDRDLSFIWGHFLVHLVEIGLGFF